MLGLGIVGLWVHIFIQGGFISGVGVGLTHTVSKTLVCTFLGIDGLFFGLGVGISSDV